MAIWAIPARSVNIVTRPLRAQIRPFTVARRPPETRRSFILFGWHLERQVAIGHPVAIWYGGFGVAAPVIEYLAGWLAIGNAALLEPKALVPVALD